MIEVSVSIESFKTSHISLQVNLNFYRLGESWLQLINLSNWIHHLPTFWFSLAVTLSAFLFRSRFVCLAKNLSFCQNAFFALLGRRESRFFGVDS